MSETQHRIGFSQTELISLYVELSRHEDELDDIQAGILARVSGVLYQQLSVSEMEEIDSFYETISDAGSRVRRL